MKIWFIRRNNENVGPCTIDELKNLSITKDEYVWKEGLPDWVQAGSLPELNQLFATKKPPAFSSQNKIKTGFISMGNKSSGQSYYSSLKQNKSRRRMLWIAIIFILSLITYLIYSNNQSSFISAFDTSSHTSPEYERAERAQSEKQNPAQFISAQSGQRRNLLGETVIEGSLSNAATIVAFKDVVLKVDFLSKTNTVIATENFTIYERMNAGQTVGFKVKSFVSKEVTNAAVTVLSATPAN